MGRGQAAYIREKVLGHSLQEKGLSLVWIRWCRWRCSWRLKPAPHSEHWTLVPVEGGKVACGGLAGSIGVKAIVDVVMGEECSVAMSQGRLAAVFSYHAGQQEE
jgi:hypothetical protein